MSYSNVTNQETFVGNGSNQAFAYSQNTPANANVNVSILSAAGVETKLTHVTHYDLAGVGGAGGITVTYPRTSVAPVAPFDVALTATEKLVVWIDPPHNQEFTKRAGDTYTAATIEAKFDEQMRIIQTLSEQVGRSFKVAVGQTPPVDTTASAFSGAKILIDEIIDTAATKLSVFTIDWTADYDSVELEFVGVVGSVAAAMEIQPIDTAVATTTNLEVNVSTHIGVAIAGAGNADWSTSGTYTVGNGADDWLTGTARFYNYNNGYLGGVGNYTYRNGANAYGVTCQYSRHTSAGTRWDGFDILMNPSGTISGTVRLWGFPKS